MLYIIQILVIHIYTKIVGLNMLKYILGPSFCIPSYRILAVMSFILSPSRTVDTRQCKVV